MNTERFWMVYGEGQGAPTAKHGTRDSAERECGRLARLNPGVVFYALCAVSGSRKSDIDRFELSEPDCDIPF